MSKRYGRQKKRAAQREIESLKGRLDISRGTANRVKHILQLVHRICPNSVALEAATIYSNHPMKFYPMPSNYDALVVITGEGSINKHIDIDRISLFDLEADIRSEEFRSAVHMRVSIGDNKAGYSISETGFEHVDINKISREIAYYLKESAMNNGVFL